MRILITRQRIRFKSVKHYTLAVIHGNCHFSTFQYEIFAIELRFNLRKLIWFIFVFHHFGCKDVFLGDEMHFIPLTHLDLVFKRNFAQYGLYTLDHFTETQEIAIYI